MKHVIDAQNQILGRLASQIAKILQGKIHPSYEPRLAGTDTVVVKNIAGLKTSGKKYTDKVYIRHTGYIGHLRRLTYRQIFERDPSKVLRLAVERMLPKNSLRRNRMRRLIIEQPSANIESTANQRIRTDS